MLVFYYLFIITFGLQLGNNAASAQTNKPNEVSGHFAFLFLCWLGTGFISIPKPISRCVNGFVFSKPRLPMIAKRPCVKRITFAMATFVMQVSFQELH